jgi:hypothetical protein
MRSGCKYLACFTSSNNIFCIFFFDYWHCEATAPQHFIKYLKKYRERTGTGGKRGAYLNIYKPKDLKGDHLTKL